MTQHQNNCIQSCKAETLLFYFTDRFIWSHEAILLLVDLRQKFDGLFTSSTVKQNQAWRKVAEAMSQKGHKCSSDECDRKFRGMKGRLASTSLIGILCIQNTVLVDAFSFVFVKCFCMQVTILGTS